MKIKVTNKGINIALGVVILMVIYASFMYFTKDKDFFAGENETIPQDTVIGKIKYLDCYFYLDQDGKVLASEVATQETESTKEIGDAKEPSNAKESSNTKDQSNAKNQSNAKDQSNAKATEANNIVTLKNNKNILKIDGLDLEYIRLGEQIPVEERRIFYTIIALNRMFDKKSIIPDRIQFDEKNQISLFYGQAQILLGKDYLLEEKIARIVAILPELQGMEGILHLENFEKNTKNIIFEKPKEQVQILQVQEIDDQTTKKEELDEKPQILEPSEEKED